MKSDRVILLLPLSITIFPVPDPPSVRVWLLRVVNVPDPESERFPPMLATGVPPALFRNANLAEILEMPPSKRSLVI